eukprot:CAMPEP_0196184274 /NCGR_PEP_ID=MMETSP0911-20130528/33553_1 /TAXON_ID=49265 /ORGANISM="Thalassiosira rotula, Strain GSO102" /LENGTH=54 /DNA_ID=CAMNT_0041454409 /DNA_START=236 /DNA_END=396 /DNA_ORIENTATION=-
MGGFVRDFGKNFCAKFFRISNDLWTDLKLFVLLADGNQATEDNFDTGGSKKSFS